MLAVTIQGEPDAGIALCQGSQKFESFTMSVAEQRKAFTVCTDYRGATFKYSAQVGTAAPEDPIIIIGRNSS
jgi:hypothetical protein